MTDIQAITINVTQQVVTVSQKGVPGDRGPPGTGTGTAFVFQQPTPAPSWTINHNLGYRPQVTLFDTGNSVFNAQIDHPSINQTIVRMASGLSMAGSARLQ